ncbi:hypothetical protein Tco_1474371 [Tanacetum coccineum]
MKSLRQISQGSGSHEDRGRAGRGRTGGAVEEMKVMGRGTLGSKSDRRVHSARDGASERARGDLLEWMGQASAVVLRTKATSCHVSTAYRSLTRDDISENFTIQQASSQKHSDAYRSLILSDPPCDNVDPRSGYKQAIRRHQLERHGRKSREECERVIQD